MNPRLQRVQALARRSGLLASVDKIRYGKSLLELRRKNQLYLCAHPDFAVPPTWLAFDAYSAPDWEFYGTSGEATARFLVETARRYLPSTSPLCVLEWGCGPGRIIRHLAEAFGATVEICGSDYNPSSIQWCRENISGVTFMQNDLQPPLPFDAESFDFVYAVSVFTHLSDATSRHWIEELHRVIGGGGVLMMTTNGDSSRALLLPAEQRRYDTLGMVERGRFKEGKKMFVAFHAPNYVRQHLLSRWEVLEYSAASFPYVGQDTWVLRRLA